MKKILLIILTFYFIVGCSKVVDENMVLICKGKNYQSESFGESAPRNSISDIKEIIRIEKHYESSKKDKFEWVLSVDGESSVYVNRDETYPKLKTKTILFVDPHKISMTWTTIGGLEEKERNTSRHITINRYTGDWSDESHEKTIESNGGKYSYKSRIEGVCEKGVTKF